MSYFINDLGKYERCNHPEHDPPSHIVVPRDKIYVHECPLCGKCSWLTPETYTL